jgi:hypothetical protein
MRGTKRLQNGMGAPIAYMIAGAGCGDGRTRAGGCRGSCKVLVGPRSGAADQSALMPAKLTTLASISRR